MPPLIRFLRFLSLAAISIGLVSGLLVRTASGATIESSGTVTASGLNFGTVLAYNPFAIYPFSNLDSGAAVATAIAGFSSLASVSPADLTITFGDLERVGTNFPGGCVPSPAANCTSVTNVWGNNDATTPFLNVHLAGVGTILSGTIQSWQTTTDTTYPGNPSFGSGTGVGIVQFHGGLNAYWNEVLALTGGTGIAQVTSTRFNSVCSISADPCPFSLNATLTFVPEPSSALFIGMGLMALGFRPRRA